MWLTMRRLAGGNRALFVKYQLVVPRVEQAIHLIRMKNPYFARALEQFIGSQHPWRGCTGVSASRGRNIGIAMHSRGLAAAGKTFRFIGHNDCFPDASRTQ